MKMTYYTQLPHFSATSSRSRLLTLGFWIFILWLALPQILRAAPTPLVITNPDSVLAATLKQLQGAPLSLQQAMELALRQATTVRTAEAELRAAGGTVRRERGAFDPELFAELSKSGRDLPSASPFAGADVLTQDEFRTSTGVRITLPLGTSIAASMNTIKTETNSAFATLNPQYQAEGLLQITQPLLKGFGAGTSSDLTSSKRELEAAQAAYEDAVLAVTSTVEQTYWDLYAAERDLAVQILIRDQSQSFLNETRLRSEAGLVGPNQVANARVFLAEQEQAVLDREENLDRISDQLASLIGERPQSNNGRFHPQSEPAADFPLDDIEQLVPAALETNRSLKVAADLVAAARAREQGARWNALPTLDLVGAIGGVGLAGDAQPVVLSGDTVRSSFDGSFGDAYSAALQRDNPTWSIGLRLSYPIGLRSGAGERDRLRGETARAEQQYLAVRRTVEEDLRRSHRELAHARKRLEVARDGVDASVEQVRIGTLEYNAGRTTAFELVRLAADLAAAQQRYSQALVRAAKAAAALKRLTTGTIEGLLSE